MRLLLKIKDFTGSAVKFTGKSVGGLILGMFIILIISCFAYVGYSGSYPYVRDAVQEVHEGVTSQEMQYAISHLRNAMEVEEIPSFNIGDLNGLESYQQIKEFETSLSETESEYESLKTVQDIKLFIRDNTLAFDVVYRDYKMKFFNDILVCLFWITCAFLGILLVFGLINIIVRIIYKIRFKMTVNEVFRRAEKEFNACKQKIVAQTNSKLVRSNLKIVSKELCKKYLRVLQLYWKSCYKGDSSMSGYTSTELIEQRGFESDLEWILKLKP